MISNPTPTFGDVVSYVRPRVTAASVKWPRWRVRYVDPDGTLTLDLLGGRRGRSTARFGVDPAKVVIRERAGQSAEDDKTASEAVVPVAAPKFEVMSAAHHRNGVSGRGFYVGIVKHWGDLPEGAEPRLLQVIAAPEEDAPEDVSKITFENGSGVEIYVTDLMVIAKQGTVAFGLNSFRGDHFYAEARAIIIQTRADWDNQMLRLQR